MAGMGDRYNSGKRKWGLLSWLALTELVKVLEVGAAKYAPFNWAKGLSWTECYESLQRHLVAWMGGEDKDPETGLYHMAHVLCNAMFLVHFIVTGTGKDDRPTINKNIDKEVELDRAAEATERLRTEFNRIHSNKRAALGGNVSAGQQLREEAFPGISIGPVLKNTGSTIQWKRPIKFDVPVTTYDDPVVERGVPDVQADVRPETES